MYNSLEELRSQLGGGQPTAKKSQDSAYRAKMMHEIPETKVLDRVKFVQAKTGGQRVLEFGASGPVQKLVREGSAYYLGTDLHGNEAANVVPFDLDDVTQQILPGSELDEVGGPTIIFCGEIIEHLTNPGWFLTRLKRQYPGVPVLITVPNGLSNLADHHLKNGIENVNIDHVAWYSWRTIKTLLNRVGYEIKEFYWYNGSPRFAEGLIVLAE
jgi:hypothetical protein